MKEPQLTEDLVWQADGHLAEIALSVLADGEEALLPEDAREHFSACSDCALRLAEVAEWSAKVSEGLSVERTFASAPHRAPPLLLWTAALAATLGMVSSLADAPRWLGPGARAGSQVAQVAYHTGRVLLRSGVTDVSPILSAGSVVAAATLVFAGFLVARSRSKKEVFS